MITPLQRAKAIQSMQMIQTDVAADTSRREGLPLTGPNVAQALGELAAQVGAIARGVEILLSEGEDQ